jgi:glycosyltransferase involved in cell wall biosynthesis
VLLTANGKIPYSFSHVNRELARALLEANLARVQVAGLATEHRAGMEFAELSLPFVDAEVRHTFPPRFDFSEDDGRLKSLFLSWETSHAPLAWAEGCENLDRVFTFSAFSSMALENAGVPVEKCRVLPLACDHEIFRPDGPRMYLGKGTTVFLNVATFDDRKGTLELVQAYLDAFTGDDDVLLAIKSNSFGTRCQSQVEQMRSTRSNPPLVNYAEREMAPDELAKVMRSCTVGVFPFKAEGGFGLPALEILACGRPVAVSHFGAPLGFTNLVNGWWLAGKTISSTFKSDHHTENPSAQWFKPDHDGLMEFLRSVHRDRDAVEEKAKICSSSVASYTWQQTARLFIEQVRKDLEDRLG